MVAFPHRPDSKQDGPPPSISVIHQVRMAGVLYLITRPIPPEGVIGPDFPRAPRTRFTTADPFAMPTLCTALGRE